MTDAEHVLWRELRKRQTGVTFRRQEPVSGFIVDFYAPSIQLAVEVDGPVHDGRRGEDAARDMKLACLNVLVLRFTNDDVIHDLCAVLAAIRKVVRARSDAPPLRVTFARSREGPPRDEGGSRGERRSGDDVPNLPFPARPT